MSPIIGLQIIGVTIIQPLNYLLKISLWKFHTPVLTTLTQLDGITYVALFFLYH